MLTRFKNLCFFAAFLAITILAVSSAHAQKNDPPSGQFGLGLYVGSEGGGGLDGVYAINKNIQVGTVFDLGVSSPGSTTFELAPFFRYQFTSTVSPFFQGGFSIVVANSQTEAGLFLGGGIAYYLGTHFGIVTDFNLLTVIFSPSFINFGWANARVGGIWFF